MPLCRRQTILRRSPMTIRCIYSPARPIYRRPPIGPRHFRSVLGVRDDYQHGTDIDYLAALHETAGYTPMGAQQAQSLLQPKGSLIYTPSDSLEFYLARAGLSQRGSARGESGHERGPGTSPYAAARTAGRPGSGHARHDRNPISPSPSRSITYGSSPRPSSTRMSAQDYGRAAEPPLWL